MELANGLGVTAFDPLRDRKVLLAFQRPVLTRALVEAMLTILSFAALWTLMAVLATVSMWYSIILAIPAAAFLVRLFMIQHDCGHGSMFASRWANDWLGRVLGVLTLTPYDMWRRSHALHHSGSGHLGKRGIGDVTTLTVREYRASTSMQRLTYRIYRHPLVIFGIGPAYLFLLQHRLPVGAMRGGAMPWASTMLTNAGIIAVAALLIWAVGLASFIVVHLPIVLVASCIGVWLFYVQHQFEHTSWEDDEGWSHPMAALHGSSYYDLPWPLMWLTGNIGIHHLHHLNSRIPFYRLREALDAAPALKQTSRLTFAASLRCVRLTLWDEDLKRLISFSEYRRMERGGS